MCVSDRIELAFEQVDPGKPKRNARFLGMPYCDIFIGAPCLRKLAETRTCFGAHKLQFEGDVLGNRDLSGSKPLNTSAN